MSYYHTINVTGKGLFPLDMLRYDCAFPANPDSVSKMNYERAQFGSPPEARTIRLGAVTTNKACPFTPDRWRTFGWVTSDWSYSYCKHCKMYVQVDSYPEPNGIDIGGNAVAINCGGTV